MPPLVTFLTPAAGKWYIITKFKKEVESILYNPGETDTSSLKVLGWPYSKSWFKLRFDEFVSDVETAKSAIITNPHSPSFGERKYKSYRTFENSKLVIGTREEFVDHLELEEIHPAVVEVITNDGTTLEVVLNIAYEVNDPIKTKKVSDFLLFGASFVVEAFRLWCNSRSYDENRVIKTDGDDPNVPDEISEKIDKLNANQFSGKGFTIPHVAVIVVAITPRSKPFVDAIQQIGEAKNKAEADKSVAEGEIALVAAQKARNAAELEFRKADADIKGGLINAVKDSLVAQNQAWGTGGLTHLYFGSGSTNNTNPTQAIFEGVTQANDFADDNTDARRSRPGNKGKNKKKNSKQETGEGGGDDEE